MKRGLFKTGSRVETDVVHAKVYTKLQKRVKGCTIPILADRFLNAETDQDNYLSTSGTNNALRFQGYVKLLSFRKLNSISWDTILYHKEEREMD